MSRIGKLPIEIKAGVTVSLESNYITVKGPKGELKEKLLEGVDVDIKDNIITITRNSDDKIPKANHGLMRTLVANMITGVTDGFIKELSLSGVGYRVSVSGKELKLKIGLSHEVIYKIPDDINISTEQNDIKVEGISKQRVGQVASEIRSFKKPEPYKGKGISYKGERILRKSGKSGKE